MRFTKSLRSDSGATAVEFALIGGVLFLLLFGIVQFGIAYHTHQALQAAAREGARVASVGADRDQIRGRVSDSLSVIDPANYSCPAGIGQYCVELTPNTAQPCGANTPVVTVLVRSRARINIPLWSSPVVTMQGRGVFRCY